MSCQNVGTRTCARMTVAAKAEYLLDLANEWGKLVAEAEGCPIYWRDFGSFRMALNVLSPTPPLKRVDHKQPHFCNTTFVISRAWTCNAICRLADREDKLFHSAGTPAKQFFTLYADPDAHLL